MEAINSIIRILLLAIAFGGLSAKIRAQDLTVDQTIGLLDQRPEEGPLPWPKYARANPEAAESLRETALKSDNHMHVAAAARLLGFVGETKEDADFLASIHSRYRETPLQADFKKDAVCAVMDGLAIMATKKVPGAEDSLKSMFRLDYWQDAGISWYDPAVIKKDPTRRYFPILSALHSYSLTGDQETVEAECKKIVESKELSEEGRKNLEFYFSPELLMEYGQRVRKQVATGDLTAVQPTRNGVDTPATPSTWSKNDSMGRIILSAMNAYQQYVTIILDRKDSELSALNLADSGKLLPGKVLKGKMSSDEWKKELDRVAALLTTIREANCTYGSVSVRTTTEEVVEETRPGSASYRIARKAKRIVTIPLVGSEEIAKQVALSPRSAPTVQDGKLVVYMIEEDGQWYWNPFGW